MKTRVQSSGFRIQETGTRACRLQRWRPDALFGSLLAFLCSAMAATAADPSARAAFDAGAQAFAASNWPAASNAFLEAAAAAPAAKLDPAAAFYNAGLAAYAAGDLKAAADSFARAAAGSDLRLQSLAYYNRGNALFHQAGGPAAAPAMPLPAMSTQALAGAEASVGEAIQMYENAIALDPRDVDAKANYELAVLKQQQLQQQRQQQQQQQQSRDPKDQQNQDQQNQQNQQQEEPKDQKQDQQQQQPQAEQQPRPENQSEESPQPEAEQIKPDKPSEEMTPEEAALMLDAMKAQEQSQRDRLQPFFGRPVPVEKDW